MAKKRERKAWMVVSKKTGVPVKDSFGYDIHDSPRVSVDFSERIIRVRIVEDTKCS